MEALNWIGNEIDRSLEVTGLDQASRAQNEKLRHVCKEFETVLASSLIKNSLKASMTSAWDDEGGGDTANNGYMDMVHTNLGKYIGEQGLLGLADSLYDELSQLQTPELKL
ncbi:hypothetical protein BVX99_02650 [bacterium F16]|nr:hypothetical protein BVX99_02650 [bacterium F16]